MRLLKVKADGEFSLVEYAGSKSPQYAILSHTWGKDQNEVNHNDLLKGMGKSKIGYR